MPNQMWSLFDRDRDVYVESIALGLRQFGCNLSVQKRRLFGGLRDGVDVIEVDNGSFSMAILPTRGMSIWKARAGDVTLGWDSPVKGPVHPKFVPVAEPSGIGWLNGFDEWFVRCGLESNGEPEFETNGRLKNPLHGKIANLPANRVEIIFDEGSGELTILGVVEEARLFCNSLQLTTRITTRAGERGFRVADEVTNISARDAELELLYHINFGPPLLEAGAKVLAPIEKLAPRTQDAAKALAEGTDEWSVYSEPDSPGQPEQVFYTQLATDADGGTQTLLHNAAANRGASLHFNRRQLPYFIVWKSNQMRPDGYVTGLEPALNFPNAKTFEDQQGRVRKLSPGETFTSEIRVEVHETAESVQTATSAIKELAAKVTPEVHRQPLPGWVNC